MSNLSATAGGANPFAQAVSDGSHARRADGASAAAKENNPNAVGGRPDKDANAPKFGDVLQNIQTKYGAAPPKPREIKKTLGKDDFLKIMVTQMKNQDPTKPFDAEQMASQMAQFASVEQLQNINQGITKMTAGNNPMERLAMTGLIGKTVTIDRDRFPHDENKAETLSFALPRDAKEVHVAIMSDTGETVFEKELGSQKAGDVSFGWDGIKTGGMPAKAGNYIMQVVGKDSHGATIQMDSKRQARVVGVSFEGNEAVFLVGDNKHQDKVTMKNIVKIDDLGGSPSQVPVLAPPPSQDGAAAGGAAAQNEQPKQNYFNFQRGQGSSDLPGAPANAAQAAAASQGQAQLAQAAPSEEKGFPNGLAPSPDEEPGNSRPLTQNQGVRR